MKEFIQEDDPQIDILFILNEYADKNPEFESKFLDGVDAYFSRENKITDSQFEKLKQVHYKIFNEEFNLEVPSD